LIRDTYRLTRHHHIPQEVIEAHREKIVVHRLLKELRNEHSGT
jgi:hypothetical protein